jgi:hypothetical protein
MNISPHTYECFCYTNNTSMKLRLTVGLEPGPLSLVSTIEELLERKSSSSGLESREYAVGIRHADHVAPSIRKRWH